MRDPLSDKIRVMIVDDIAETRENIRKLLQFEPDFDVVATARSGREALRFASEQEPHVVLMDINMPDMDGIAATEAIVRDIPFTQIVILSVQSDADYMRQAMLAGARDFLAKPPAGDELINTIRKLGRRSQAEQEKLAVPLQAAPGRPGAVAPASVSEARIIAVYSPKGGVGCTTVATNMAVALQTEDTRVVLVDGSVQFGDVEVFLNLHSKNSIADLVDRVDELDVEFVESVMVPHSCGLKVLSAPPRPELADEIGEGATGAERMRKILEFLRYQFAYVVVDTASVLTDITLTILDISDVIVLVATPDIPAIKDVRLFFDLMDALDYPARQIVLVLNRMGKRSGITAAAVEENIKHTVEAQIASDERTVITSINQGIPFILGDKGRAPIRGLLDVVRAVKEVVAEPEEEAVVEGRKTAERMRLFGV